MITTDDDQLPKNHGSLANMVRSGDIIMMSWGSTFE
jgi:hypothetical protein